MKLIAIKTILKLSILSLIIGAVAQAAEPTAPEPITVFTAKKIVTMDPTRPTATAVAVRGKRIVSVGSLEDFKPWLDAYPHTIDKRFADKVLMPGLIDPHLHPLLGALQFGATWITPEAWQLHDANIPAARTPAEYWKRLKAAVTSAEGDGKPLFVTWGWSGPIHGPMARGMLDALGSTKPIMVWQRSVHEAVFNTPALEWMKLSESDVANQPAINWEKGHFVESGLFEVALPRLAPYFLSPAYVDAGFDRSTAYLISGGVTTVGDLSTGKIDWDLEMATFKRNLIDKAVPYRTVLIPAAHKLAQVKGGLDASFEFINQQLTKAAPAPQIVLGKRIKLFADGAMFSLLMQMNEPGYIDGHRGEWITPPDEFEKEARKYWNAGYRIHVHANGDKGIAFTLGVFEKLQAEKPRLPHSFVIEHYGYADDVLNRRVALDGAAVSANPYYLHALGDTYSKVGLGADRAQRITPLAGLVDRGVTVALHSDFGMAPARPLFLAWCAATRMTESGNVMIPPRGLTLDEALKAVTVDAAYVLGLEKDLGSIQSGKLADFAVLNADPFAVGVKGLRDIKVWGTVFEGKPAPAN